MPIDDQLLLQMAYEMPSQRFADIQATLDLMETIGALCNKGLSKRCKAINAVNTDRIVQPRTTLVSAHNRSKDSRKIIPIGFAGKRPELTIRQ
ncbi:hypothetical protein MF4836_30525 [Pseudomonas sp. MF4836]|nr:hypothetical protein MF4836_30525 [Pseudomonas sp. MF4836]